MSHYPPHATPYQAGPVRPGGHPPAGDRITAPLLVASVLCTGLMAGLFFAYDISVMPGLAELDDAAYAAAMQRFNAAIDGSALFGLVFLATLGLTVAAAIVAFRRKRRAVALPLAAAALCYLLVLVVTVAVNLPLNADLAALGGSASARGRARGDRRLQIGLGAGEHLPDPFLCSESRCSVRRSAPVRKAGNPCAPVEKSPERQFPGLHSVSARH